MEDYRLEQSGQEVQDILNGAAMQTDLTAENERAELAEQTLQGNIDAEALARENADGVLQGHIDDEETRAKAAEKQNADDIDAIEEKIPTQASSSNQLADKDYVEDLVSTSSATFRGTFNLVSDLHLTVDASYADIAAALGNAIAGADNNDFAFVMIPTSVDTPNEIASIEKYKFNGSVWGFEYMLNNSGFTAAQWAAINSGITSALVTKLGALPTAAELATALLAKQDKLTFDQAPTPSSTNPVTSGGVYTAIDDEKGARVNADAALQQSIEAILVLIPSAATALNQLADKAFVNSSIATATATFRGTFNLVSDLQLTVDATHADIAAALLNAISGADNNDYAFVQIPTSVDTPTEIRVTERYKFNGTAWGYEYDLNNSGFTAAQWAAINSGITTLLVAKLSNLPNATELAALFAGKQNVLTFDNAPASGSDNPVKSGGLYNLFAAIDAKMPTGASANNKLVAEDRLAAYVGGIIGTLDATFDLTSTDGHVTLRMTQTDGVITSLQILTSDIASASALATLGGQVSTNADDIAALQALYNALQQSAPQIIEPTDTWPVASPSGTVIYRVVDRVNTPPQYYSDYMWNGTAMVLMATYNNAIDPRPKKASQNLVTSGGVFDNMGALDVSELNATENPHALAQYVDLSAALAAVPIDYQKGGMSIKFVQSSDNKYVQYFLIKDEWSANEADWEKMNLEVINQELYNFKRDIEGVDLTITSASNPKMLMENTVYPSVDIGSIATPTSSNDNYTFIVPCFVGELLTIKTRNNESYPIFIVDNNFQVLEKFNGSNDAEVVTHTITSATAAFVVANALPISYLPISSFYVKVYFKGKLPELENTQDIIKKKLSVADSTILKGAYNTSTGVFSEEYSGQYRASEKFDIRETGVPNVYGANVIHILLWNANGTYLGQFEQDSVPWENAVFYAFNFLLADNPDGFDKFFIYSGLLGELSTLETRGFHLNGKTIFLFGDSISSDDYPWYKQKLAGYTKAVVLNKGASGRDAAYLASNAYFSVLASNPNDIVVVMVGGNDIGASGTIGTFDANSLLAQMGESVVSETDISVDYNGTKFIQAISHIIRKWRSIYWNFRLNAGLTANIIDTQNNNTVVYPASGAATELQCIDYANTQGWTLGYNQRYVMMTTETVESKQAKLSEVRQPKLFLCTTLPQRRYNATSEYSNPENCERKRLACIECAQKYGVPLIDLAKEFAIDWDSEPYWPGQGYTATNKTDNQGIYTMDGLHPNEFGYDYISQIVAKHLVK